VIFVTHDRYFLDVIATRIIELADGRCFSHPGNYTAYLESKAIRQQIAEQSERRRQRFLREELEWVRAGVRAQRSKPRHRLESFYDVKGLEAQQEERKLWEVYEKQAMDKAKAAGIQIIEVSDADKKAFQDAVKPVWDKYGPKHAEMVKRIQEVK